MDRACRRSTQGDNPIASVRRQRGRSLHRCRLAVTFMALTLSVAAPALTGQTDAACDTSAVLFAEPKADSTARIPAEDLQIDLSEPARKRHTLYLEILGAGVFYSLNYEYRIWKMGAIRGGGGIVKTFSDFTYVNMLAMAMFVTSETGHALEVGAGGVGIHVKDKDGSTHFGTAGALAAGWRYQSSEPGIMGRLTFTPLYYKREIPRDHYYKRWRIMIGLSFGYTL